MEVAQNRGLTLRPIDGLSDSDDETPEDLALSTSLSIHPREDSFIDFIQRNSSETQVSQFNLFLCKYNKYTIYRDVIYKIKLNKNMPLLS